MCEGEVSPSLQPQKKNICNANNNSVFASSATPSAGNQIPRPQFRYTKLQTLPKTSSKQPTNALAAFPATPRTIMAIMGTTLFYDKGIPMGTTLP